MKSCFAEPLLQSSRWVLSIESLRSGRVDSFIQWIRAKQNIQHLQSRKKSKTWGEGSWKKVVVCIVSDGRSKINPRTLKILGLYGAYQDGIMKDEVLGKDVTGHVFEYTTQVVVDSHGVVSGGIAPVQIIFCLKEQNKKKLNSHRWCFNAFCPQLKPNVCILLDVGTRPSGTSIYSLWYVSLIVVSG